MMMGTSLRTVWRKAEAKAQSKQIVEAGGEALMATAPTSINQFTGTLGGTVYPIFVLGFDDPDDTVHRLVP